MKYLIFILLAVGLVSTAEVSNKAYIEEQSCELPHRPLLLRQGNAVLVDSSGNPYSAWTQIHECLAFNSTVGGLQFVNRGYWPTGNLYAHQTDADFSFWIHDYVYDGIARYPNSVAGYDPYISFVYATMAGSAMGIGWAEGGWFSSFWSIPTGIPSGVNVGKCIAKQLPDSTLILIGTTFYNEIIYVTLTYDLSTILASGVLGSGMHWGVDINGGFAYVFYIDFATLGVYYRVTTDGITWSYPEEWVIPWPTPYTNNVVDWTQMALTDAGNPILVFDIADADDPGYPQCHKVYAQVGDGATPIQVSDDAYDASWYPTIATGGDYVVILFHVWTNTEQDSLARNDIFYVYSPDDGVTWSQPYNLTETFPNRPGLPQLAKRLNAIDLKFYYFFGMNLVTDYDIIWSILSGHDTRLEPTAWYVGWHPITIPGVEENKQNLNLLTPQLSIYPNPFRQITDIRYQITEEVDSRQKIVVSMKIYDAAGRLVKSFTRSTLDALRPTHITWQGDDDFGRPVPAGVYFVHLENGDNVIVEKIIKLK